MRKFKIAYLLTQSLESPSGLGRFGPIAREMAKRGHEVEIFALHPDFDSLALRSSSTGQARINYVARMHILKRGDDKIYYSPIRLATVTAQATWQLTKAAFSTKAEIIHICKPHPMNGIAGFASKLARGKTLMVDCDDYEVGLGNFSNRFQKTVVAYFEKKVPHLAQAVTTNTAFMRDKLISWGLPPEKITYIPNGYEPSRFQTPEVDKIRDLKSQLGLNDKKIISYVGTVGFTSHPVDLLVKAFAKIKAVFDQSALLIVGGGEDLDRLKTEAIALGLGNSVIFTGRVPPEQVTFYYRMSDVTVDPVHDDDAARGRSPLKLFEGWACGVPVVTAAVGDRPDLMAYPPAGILSIPGDVSSLADCILEVIQNPILAQQIQQNGLERAKLFTWDRLVVDLENAYSQTLRPDQ